MPGRRSPLLGLLLIFALSWPIDLALAAQSRGLLPLAIPPLLGLLVGYTIVAAALAATAREGGWPAAGRLLRRFALWRVSPRCYAVALLALPALYLAALAIDAATGGAPRDLGSGQVFGYVPAGLALWIVVPGWFLFEALTNGEEIGWRGYLLPRLQARYAPLVATALVATVWGVWHLPKFLVVPTPYDWPVWLWAVDIGAKAVLATWIWNTSGGSLLLATLFHASYNTAAGTLPILPASDGDVRPWTIAILLLAFAALAVAIRDPWLGLPRPQRAAAPALTTSPASRS